MNLIAWVQRYDGSPIVIGILSEFITPSKMMHVESYEDFELQFGSDGAQRAVNDHYWRQGIEPRWN